MSDATDPWTLFWQTDQLDSCQGAEADRATLAGLWAGFAASLGPGARVLDLATGQGAVVRALLAAAPELEVTGIDRARIGDADGAVAGFGAERVRLLSDIDLRDPQGVDGPFDALTSQFGIEYAGPDAGVAAARRWLSRGGRFCWLLHHADSAVAAAAANDAGELGALLDEDGLLAALERTCRGAMELEALERRVRGHMDGRGRRTRRLTGTLVAFADRLLSALESVPAADARDEVRTEAQAWLASVRQRMQAERDRLSQLLDCALDADALAAWRVGLEAVGCSIERAEPLHSMAPDAALIGWVLAGWKP